MTSKPELHTAEAAAAEAVATAVAAEADVCPPAQTVLPTEENSHVDKASASGSPDISPIPSAPAQTTLPMGDNLQVDKASASGSPDISFIPSQDDGYTIADMSGIDGMFSRQRHKPLRDVREELGDSDSRRALIFGATWAGLSLALVYIIVFGVVIAVLLWLWY
ncbi:MAG: hypothetical protein IJ125_05290 [Atopobiaceae bacterium]|nr:hypothetical protein [Atopobiaceae bacterium]